MLCVTSSGMVEPSSKNPNTTNDAVDPLSESSCVMDRVARLVELYAYGTVLADIDTVKSVKTVPCSVCTVTGTVETSIDTLPRMEEPYITETFTEPAAFPTAI